MDAGPANGDGRRRGGGKKRGRQRRKRSKGRRGNQNQRSKTDKLPTSERDDRSVLGGRVPPSERRQVMDDGPPDAFRLFCAYHLGITPTDGYHRPHLEEVAKRFGVPPKQIRAMLVEFGIDEESIRAAKWDLEGAQLDIRVAPEGVSKTEIARDLFEDFQESRAQLNSGE